MIHIPKLTLGGSEARLGSRIKACRSPESAWPEDILHEPLCMGEKAGKTVVLLADPDEISRVLVEQEKDFPKWLPIYRHSAARETGTGTIFAATDADWARLRRAIKPLFHSRRWSILTDVARQATFDAASRFDLEEVEKVFTAISVDVIFRTLVGDDDTVPADYDISGISEGLVERQDAGDLHGAMRHVHELGAACLSRRPGPVAIENVDWAGPTPLRPRPMQEPDLSDNRLALLYAGQETTALTMSWCFWILGQDRDLRSRLRREVRDAVSDARGWTQEAIKRMPRLMAVLRETMRLLSPSSATVRTTRHDTVLCGRQVPKDSVIVIPIYAVHRHRSRWDDPDTFDPERFLRATPHPMAFLPFAAGRHTCAAARSVMYEMATVLASLLDGYDWETIDPQDMGITNKLVLSPTTAMKVSLTT